MERTIMLEHKKENDFILRWPEVIAKIGLSKSTIHLMISDGRFPKPIKLNKRAVGWFNSEVDDWLFDRLKQTFIENKMQGR